MQYHTDALALGEPRFLSSKCAELAGKEGSIAAWREAFATDGLAAAAAVEGDFAIGIKEPA